MDPIDTYLHLQGKGDGQEAACDKNGIPLFQPLCGNGSLLLPGVGSIPFCIDDVVQGVDR